MHVCIVLWSSTNVYFIYCIYLLWFFACYMFRLYLMYAIAEIIKKKKIRHKVLLSLFTDIVYNVSSLYFQIYNLFQLSGLKRSYFTFMLYYDINNLVLLMNCSSSNSIYSTRSIYRCSSKCTDLKYYKLEGHICMSLCQLKEF